MSAVSAAAMRPELSTTVDLYIQCNRLPSFDIASKSDPFVIARMAGSGGWVEVGRTEVVSNSSDPRFTTKISVTYKFEEQQRIHFEVFDYDSRTKADFIGSAEITIGKLMGARGQTITTALSPVPISAPPSSSTKRVDRGTITITGVEVSPSLDVVRLVFGCRGLDKKDWFGSSDPFIVINRKLPSGAVIPVWQSPVVENNLNPDYAPVEISIQTFCGGDFKQQLQIQVFDWNRSGKHTIIGETVVAAGDLMTAVPKSFMLLNPKKLSSKSGSGSLLINYGGIVKVPSFLEYIRGGLKINLVTAIDLTGSNGDPRDRGSLHSFNPAENQYIQAIQACGSILLDYDDDRLIPAFGFGATVNGRVEHCFALNFNEAAPEVPGLEGLLAAYRNVFNYVSLAGPTYLSPTIMRTTDLAGPGRSQTDQRYTILLLITDGICNDLDNTIRAIVRASHTPLSVVIVGVGRADFSDMHALDSDGKLLSTGDSVALRDCVQFVDFQKFASFGVGAGTALAREVLAEIPQQVVQYFTRVGVLPNPPTTSMPVAPSAAPTAFPSAPSMSVAPSAAPMAPAAGAGAYAYHPPPMQAVPVPAAAYMGAAPTGYYSYSIPPTAFAGATGGPGNVRSV